MFSVCVIYSCETDAVYYISIQFVAYVQVQYIAYACVFRCSVLCVICYLYTVVSCDTFMQCVACIQMQHIIWICMFLVAFVQVHLKTFVPATGVCQRSTRVTCHSLLMTLHGNLTTSTMFTWCPALLTVSLLPIPCS